MQVAALYDIHGNLPALEAVLEEVCRREVDVIVVGGDVVPGPMAGEALSRLLSLGQPVRFIRGNCETEVLAAIDGKPLSPMPNRPERSFGGPRSTYRPSRAGSSRRGP